MLLTRTSPRTNEIFELLADLSACDDIDINGITIVHTLRANPQRKISEMMEEIAFLHKTIPKTKNINFLSLSGCFDDIRHIRDFSSEFISQCGSNHPTVLGIDLDSKYLSSTNQSVDSIFRQLDELKMDVLTIAANCFTSDRIGPIVKHAKDSLKMTVIATEVLRTHPTRPGLLTANYQANPNLNQKNVSTPTAQEGTTALQSKLADIIAATEDFQMALDRCLQMEKLLFPKISQFPELAAVPSFLTSICMAHVLIKTHNQFLYPEEWSYVLREQILPRFDEMAKLLSESEHQECKDWMALYRPMVAYLWASYRQLLQARTLHLGQEVVDLLHQNAKVQTSQGGDLASLPVALSLLNSVQDPITLRHHFDFITLANTQIESNHWNGWVDDLSRQGMLKDESTKKLTQRAIQELLNLYNQDT